MKNYQELSVLTGLNKVGIIGHLNADVDALCSMVCLKEFLMEHFKVKDVQLLTDTRSIHENCLPILENEQLNQVAEGFDAVIAVDSPNIDRLGKYAGIFSSCTLKIVIDHHQTNTKFGDINIVEIVSSVCEIVFKIMCEYNYNISKKNIGKLYAGVITDTMNFTVGILTQTSFEIGMRASQETDFQAIYNNFLNLHTFKNMKLLAEAIRNVKSYDNGKINISYIRPRIVKKLKSTFEDYVGIINRLASIQNSVMTCLIEPKGDVFYVSMRGKRGYNVGNVAKKYGGGGHAGAAAFDSNLSIKQLEKIILKELKILLANKDSNSEFKF